MKCRHCKTDLKQVFVDLGTAPPSNAYLSKEQILQPEKYYPLIILICEKCWLVQTRDFAEANEFFSDDYAYFSSYSSSWLLHAEEYSSNIINKLNLGTESFVVEIAANDGYLLKNFKSRQIPCLGIEPTKSTGEVAQEKGIPILFEFFGTKLARNLSEKGMKADLMIANNVLAHVPDINDFVSGFSILLKDDGTATFEFPHLLNLMKENQFDTIYHEHFSYLSLNAVNTIFNQNGLEIYDVESLKTHGGSLRVFARKRNTVPTPPSQSVIDLIHEEILFGLTDLNTYKGFQDTVINCKNEFLKLLIDLKKSGKRVVAYGAAAKGNTLLNYAGIRSDLIEFVIDKNPSKQNMFMPGSRIPIVHEDYIKETKPEFIVILPWNLSTEIINQLNYCRSWNSKFIIAIPEIKIL